MSLRSRFRLFRLFISLILLVFIATVIFQNSETVPLDILWWHGEFPLALLLFLVVAAAALVTFFLTLYRGRNTKA